MAMPPRTGTSGPQARRPSCRFASLILASLGAVAGPVGGQPASWVGRATDAARAGVELPRSAYWDLARDPQLEVPDLGPRLEVNGTAAAGTVRVSGTIRSLQSGEGLYGKVVAYDDVSGLIAAVKNSGAGGAYFVDLTPGTYGFYVRSYGRAPSLYEHVAVATDLALDPLIDTLASRWPPAYLTGASAADPVVWVDGNDATSVTLVSTKDLGPVVEVFNEFGSIVVDGQRRVLIDLHDDGTHGDAVAGDHTYTRAGVGFGGDPVFLGGRVGWDVLVYVYIPGGAPPVVAIPSVSLLGMNPGEAVPVRTLTTGAQCSRYAAAIVAATSGWIWDQKANQLFYRSFADIYDFVYLFPDSSMGDIAGMSGNVFNDVTGIGKPPHDNRVRHGSRRLLNYMIIHPHYYVPLLHETMHHWGADLNELFDTTRFGWHWGYSGVHGQLGGFDPAKLKQNPDGSYSTGGASAYGVAEDALPYAGLELYLAGLVDTLDELGDIPVLINAPTSGDATVFADGVRYVSGGDIVATYGPRDPPASAAQHRFNAAFFWVTAHPANAASMAYLDLVARLFAGLAKAPRVLSFTDATRGVGAVDPTIKLAPRLHRTVPRAR